MNKQFTEACCVSGKDCNAPGGYKTLRGIYACNYRDGTEKGQGARLVCFACGDAVCENCSAIYDYYDYGKKIICDSCAEDHDLIKNANVNCVGFAKNIDKKCIM